MSYGQKKVVEGVKKRSHTESIRIEKKKIKGGGGEGKVRGGQPSE